MNTVLVPTAPDLSQELFELNSHALDINPASSDGAKHYMKITEELLEKDKVKVTISNFPSIKVQFKSTDQIIFLDRFWFKNLMTVVLLKI